MQALKDIGDLSSLLGNSPIAQSPLWTKPVDQIVPAQFIAFQTRLTFDGHGEEAKVILETILGELKAAHVKGSIPHVPVLDFTIPLARMTLGDLRKGLEQLERPRPAAVLFGLEADLEIDEVISLTWEKAKVLREGHLSKIARELLRLAPRHLGTPYVFWQTMNGAPAPLFGLSLELAAIFDMEWPELRKAYRTIAGIDLDMERAHWFE
ncbi:hypothetical protein [Paraburkholderia sp.]|uniref:hypothetical protein n=1 Tax=Paraburkholderia sp. TaxID=1926495 RepID=UPI0039E63C40